MITHRKHAGRLGAPYPVTRKPNSLRWQLDTFAGELLCAFGEGYMRGKARHGR